MEFSQLDVDEQGLTVAISIGGTLLLPGNIPDGFVQRTDELMYRSKQDATVPQLAKGSKRGMAET